MVPTQDFEQIIESVRSGINQLFATVDNMRKVLENKHKTATGFLTAAPGSGSTTTNLVDAKENLNFLRNLQNIVNNQAVVAESAKENSAPLKASN